MSFLLDIDRAQSVFRLLFNCTFDSVTTRLVSPAERERHFKEDLFEITQGANIPPAATQKLWGIYQEVCAAPKPISFLAAQVADDLADNRDILCSVMSIVLRVASDHGMLCAVDRERIAIIFRELRIRGEELDKFNSVERIMLATCLNGGSYGHENGASEWLKSELNSYFEVLGCTPAMSEEQIRRRYRELAMQFHPDRAAARGDKADQRRQFEQIQQAYQAIKHTFSGIAEK